MEEGGVSRVLLCGAGANLKQLQPFLANGLGLTVEIFNPLVRIPERFQPLEPEQIADGGPRLAVAIGVALDHGQGLDLLPHQVQHARFETASRRLWQTAAKGAAAVAFAAYLGLQLTGFVVARQVRGQQRLWAQLQPASTTYLTTTSNVNTLGETCRLMERFLDQQPLWEGLFKELGALVPAAIALDEVSVESDANARSSSPHFRLKGRMTSGDNSGIVGLAKFVEALDQSVFLMGVGLGSSEMHSETGTTSFTIEGRLE